MKAACPNKRISFVPIPLGGRSEVINRARLLAGQNEIPRLFLVDGDLPFVRGDRRERIDNLYYLNCYSIENVLLEPNAIAEVCLEADGSCSASDVLRRFRYSQLRRGFQRFLFPLFVLFAVTNRLAPTVPTVSRGVVRYFDSEEPRYVRRVAYRALLRELILACTSAVGWTRYRSTSRAVRASLSKRRVDWRSAVAGKDFLLPVLHGLSRRHCAFRGSRPQFAGALARHCTFSREKSLRRRLRMLAGYCR